MKHERRQKDFEESFTEFAGLSHPFVLSSFFRSFRFLIRSSARSGPRVSNSTSSRLSNKSKIQTLTLRNILSAGNENTADTGSTFFCEKFRSLPARVADCRHHRTGGGLPTTFLDSNLVKTHWSTLTVTTGHKCSFSGRRAARVRPCSNIYGCAAIFHGLWLPWGALHLSCVCVGRSRGGNVAVIGFLPPTELFQTNFCSREVV